MGAPHLRFPFLLVPFLFLLSGGDPSAAAPSRDPVAAAADVDLRLFLVGDAGEPSPRGEPVLQALGREIARDPARSMVVFLGDNLYPKGLPPPGARDRPEMERRLDAQVDVVKAAGVRGLIVPGNHDWDEGGPDGWEAVRRQVRRVDERGGPLVSALPKDGCPGPEVVDVGGHVRLVVLDTQWWLHEEARPEHPTSACPQDSEEEVTAALLEALETAGDRVLVVAAHHPLASGGPHGGHFTFRQHVFPLTDANKRLWIPLPLIGSLYPLARRSGITPQDLASGENAHMVRALEGVFRVRPPLVYAAGHEHSLQVIRGTSARYLLVSGAGIHGNGSPVKRIEGGLYASRRAGFMRLDVERSGRVRLAVLEVNGEGEAKERYSAWLE